jgi:type II secretory pathway pseudopilin PulG
MARASNGCHNSEKRDPRAIAIIRHKNAMRAEVRFRWSQEVIAGQELIRGGMETEPGDNSSISFRHASKKIAQTRCASRVSLAQQVFFFILVQAMKMRSTGKANQAMTLIEALVVVTVVGVLIAMLLPALGGSRRSSGAWCRFNVNQIDTGFLMYASDNGTFPILISVTNGGTMEFTARNQTFPTIKNSPDTVSVHPCWSAPKTRSVTRRRILRI